MTLMCPTCGYIWDYTGRRRIGQPISCGRCRRSFYPNLDTVLMIHDNDLEREFWDYIRRKKDGKRHPLKRSHVTEEIPTERSIQDELYSLFLKHGTLTRMGSPEFLEELGRIEDKMLKGELARKLARMLEKRADRLTEGL